MPNLYFISFEVTILALFGLCLRHAWRAGLPAVLRLTAGLAFGVMLELATIRQLHAYRYGQFLLMVWDVPLAIGVGWSVIIYSSMLFSDATSLPEWVRPMLDGLLALNIDLVADAIAIRLGFWNWGQGLSFQYFGVPYANFWAWFWVVASFSIGSRIFFYRPDRLGRWLAPLSAIAVGLAGVVGTNALIVFGIPRDSVEVVVEATLLSAAITVILFRPKFNVRPLAAVAFWTPTAFHAYFLAAGLLSGASLNPPILLVVAVGMIAVSAALHWHTLAALAGQASLWKRQKESSQP